MMDEQETIKKTKFFGLNTYEAKIWISLLSKGTSTAGELSDIANVPRSRSYDVLESLEKKGFVTLKTGKPIKYLTIPPKDVIKNLKRQIENKTEKHLSEIKSTSFNNLIETFQEVYEKSVDNTENIVAILKGRKNIYKHLSFLFNRAKKDILFSIENETDKYPKTTNNTKITIKTPNIGVRVCVVDEDNSIIFPVGEKEIHPDYDLGIWIRNKQTAKFLKHLLTQA